MTRTVLRGLTLLLTVTLCLAAMTGTAEAAGTVTVTLNRSTGVSGFLYCTDEGGGVNDVPADNFITYTAPFTMSSSDCMWIVAVLEDGYSVDQWSTGEISNPYSLYLPTQNVTLEVTAAKADTSAAPDKNGSFAGQEAYVENGALVVSSVNFPDPHFLSQVRKLPSAADGLLTTDDMAGITELDVSGSSIEDLSGIEFFSALTTLDCSSNRLAALDVSHNSNLTSLNTAGQNVCAAPIKVDGEYRVYLSELPGVDISKVSNVQGDNVTDYDAGIVSCTASTAGTITYSYDTGLNGAAMNVTMVNPKTYELNTNNVILFPDATFYTAGENYTVSLRGLVEGLATLSADFIRETIDDYSSLDENNPYPVFSLTGDLSLGIAAVSLSLPNAVRYAAHIFEGIWMISSAATTQNKVIKVCGILAGVFIAAYSFVCPFAPGWMLMLNVPFMMVWLFMITRGKY